LLNKGDVMGQKIGQKGLTLFEVIAVLLMVGILAAVVISRGGGDSQEAKLRSEVDTLKAHLRYAQYLALNDMEPTRWGIAINGSSYSLVRNPDRNSLTFDNPYNLPNESSSTHNMAPLTATAANVLFDEWGSPGTTTLNSTTDINITLGNQTITITAETGYIP